ncbi:MAG: hypothetical protein NZM18_10450 [Thermoflexales bacterium]|nr:hypothetical protein [Thermoflexales bacterium]MDW8351245.1 hypothetical protein [Anaerolineae bacterium]
MLDKLRLYVSAAPELRFERDVLARAVAEIPTSLGWTITQTPGSDHEPDLEAVTRADVHLLILGRDIQAPVGLEWAMARRAGNNVALFYKSSSLQTQAAQAFVREAAKFGRWQGFSDAFELRWRALRLLVDHILAHEARYEISAAEAETLRAWRKTLDAKAREKKAVDDRRGGAEESAVILTTERFIPSEGKLLQAKADGA